MHSAFAPLKPQRFSRRVEAVRLEMETMSATELLQVRRAAAQHYTRQIGHAPSLELQKSLDALEGAFKSLCAEDVARVRPGSGAARLHAGNAQRMLLAAMPKSAAAEISSARPTLLRASASAATLRRPASATPAVPLPSYTPEELNVLRLKAGRARGARPASASACCRLASAVSGESPDISATRPPLAAVSPPSRSRDPPSRPTRKLSRPASPPNVEQCASPLGAWRRYDDLHGRPAPWSS